MNPNPENYRIGSGHVSYKGNDLGGTTEEGIVVNREPEIHLHKSGKFGSTPIKATYIGETLTLEIAMGEVTKTNMERVFAGVNTGDGKVKFGGVAGREIVGGPLIFTPFDGTELWVFKNAVPTSSIEIAYQADNERVYKVTFTAMIDTDSPENEEIGYVS